MTTENSVTKTIWPTKSKIFAILFFTERVSAVPALYYRIKSKFFRNDRAKNFFLRFIYQPYHFLSPLGYITTMWSACWYPTLHGLSHFFAYVLCLACFQLFPPCSFTHLYSFWILLLGSFLQAELCLPGLVAGCSTPLSEHFSFCTNPAYVSVCLIGRQELHLIAHNVY